MTSPARRLKSDLSGCGRGCATIYRLSVLATTIQFSTRTWDATSTESCEIAADKDSKGTV
jgi:hypothetical protein